MEFEILDSDGHVVNTIVASQDFVDSTYPGRWRLIEIKTSVLPEIVVTTIVADADHQGTTTVSSNEEITCASGTTLTINAELRGSDGHIIPLSDQFRMPLRSRDGREKVLLAAMVDGLITITAPLRESGVWSVSKEAINESLPPDRYMEFSGMNVFVVEV